MKGGKERERSAGEREARRVARLAAATRRTMRSSLRPRASAPHWPWPPSGPLVGRVRRGRAARQPSPDLRNRTNSSHIVLILARKKKKKKDQKKHRKKNHEKKPRKKNRKKGNQTQEEHQPRMIYHRSLDYQIQDPIHPCPGSLSSPCPALTHVAYPRAGASHRLQS